MAEANVPTQLPPEVLVKIFEHCDLDELVNIVDVCQLWRDVVIHQHMSGNDLVIRRPDDIFNLVSLLCKPASFTKLHIVWDVPSNVDCSSVSLDALANATSLTHLQSFTFRSGVEDEFKDHRPGSMFTGLKWRHGRIGCSVVLDALMILLRQTSTDTLTHFKLINAMWKQTIAIRVVEVIEACQHLSHLVLNRGRMRARPSMRHKLGYEKRFGDIIPRLTHLELLDLRGTSAHVCYTPFVAAIKRGCPNISNNIMIDAFHVSSSDDVRVLQFVSHVGTLEIEVFDTDQLKTLISCLSESASQVNVDLLMLECYTDHLTDDILLSLVQRLRGLKKVRAELCRQLTNEGVVNVITASPQLEGINIRYIENINRDIIPLLDRVVTEKDVRIDATETKLSEQMGNRPDSELYTGKNKNICLVYR